MNSCMIAHANKTEEDAAREEWFAGLMERQQKKEVEQIGVEKRRAEIIEMTRKQEAKEQAELERKKEEEKNPGQKNSWFWGR